MQYPPEEVTNILEALNIRHFGDIILEPCCGGGHMVKGIEDYISHAPLFIKPEKIIVTDVQNRETFICQTELKAGLEYDFLSNDYPYTKDISFIIMNPPYSTLEPFIIKALEIANKGVLVLCRLQALEGKKRFENIYKENPPTDVYVYVDRINCYKNGDFSIKNNSAQAYCWLYWNKEFPDIMGETTLHFLRRKDEQ